MEPVESLELSVYNDIPIHPYPDKRRINLPEPTQTKEGKKKPE